MLPKIIHFVWLGNNQKPKSFYKNLEQGGVYASWKEYAKGFEIKEWNELSEGEFDLPEYYYSAKREKKWAFASDVLRFHVLEKYGGIYLDIDQVLIKNINSDELLSNNFFLSTYHEVNNYYSVSLMGSMPGTKLAKLVNKYYKELSPNETKYIILNKVVGLVIENNKLSAPEIKVFPQEYLCPLKKEDFTDNTYSYHLSNTSWVPIWKKALYKIPFYAQLKKVLFLLLPKKVKNKLKKVTY